MTPYLIYTFVFACGAAFEIAKEHTWHAAACVFLMLCSMVLVELNALVKTLHDIGTALKDPETKA